MLAKYSCGRKKRRNSSVGDKGDQFVEIDDASSSSLVSRFIIRALPWRPNDQVNRRAATDARQEKALTGASG
jgi:hypothetical protein